MIEKPFITLILLTLISIAASNLLVTVLGAIASLFTIVVQYARLKKIIRDDFNGSWKDFTMSKLNIKK